MNFKAEFMINGHCPFCFIMSLMFKINAKIQRKIHHYSNKLELDKMWKEELKAFRIKEKLRNKISITVHNFLPYDSMIMLPVSSSI